MIPHLRMRHFRVFLAACENRSLTRTAQALNTSQPALSRTLREIEDAVGGPLFERGPKGLVLTMTGETLRQFLAAGVAQIEQGLKIAQGAQELRTVSIGILPNVARTLIPNAVARFKSEAPEVNVAIYRHSVGDLLTMLRSGEIDFIASRMIEVEDPHGLTFEHLYAEPLVFVAAADHPLAARDEVSPEQMNQYTMVIPTQGTFIRSEMDRYLFATGFAGFSRTIETISLDFVRSYLQVDHSITCMPLGTLEKEIECGTFVRLRTIGREITGSVGLAFINGRSLSLEARRLVKLIRIGAENPHGTDIAD